MSFKIELSERGFRMFFKEYKELSLRTLWSDPEHMFSSEEVYRIVNEKLPDGATISRASIINFLQNMAEKGLLEREFATGKGGTHGIYQCRYDEAGLKKHLTWAVLDRLVEEFPGEAGEAIAGFKMNN